MIGESSVEDSWFSDLRLIDFGLCTDYKDGSGQHIKESASGSFTGNFAFASSDQMHFKTTSRRDDLISLSYLLVHLVDGTLPFLNMRKDKSK